MKKIIAILVCFVLLFVICFPSMAFADPITLSSLSSLGYALGASWGLNFQFTGYDSQGVNQYLSGKINSWLAGRSIFEVFGADQARIVAGKLIIPYQLYNGLREFLQSFKEENDIAPEQKNIFLQSGGYMVYSDGVVDRKAQYSIIQIATGNRTVVQSGVHEDIVNHGVFLGTSTTGSRYGICGVYSYKNQPYYYQYLRPAGDDKVSVAASISGEIPETVLNPDKEWSGTIGGQDIPDTNLEDLLGNIDEAVLDGILDVEGEIVDPVIPPTPVPTVAPDIPLQDVPWEGLNDLIGSSTDTIDDAIQDQTDAITGAQEATTEAVNSLTETIEGALETPTTEELPNFKFDLRELFPFCIPFDIYRLLSSFDAEPQAPHVQIPIVIDSINFRYNLDLDFSAWNPVAQAMRTAELIVYAIALAWATGRVIKW